MIRGCIYTDRHTAVAGVLSHNTHRAIAPSLFRGGPDERPSRSWIEASSGASVPENVYLPLVLDIQGAWVACMPELPMFALFPKSDKTEVSRAMRSSSCAISFS